MKNLILVAFLVAFSCVGFKAEAAPSKAQCKSILTVSGGLMIYKNSAPLRAGGRPYPAPLIGFRYEPTLIMNQSSLPNRGGTNIYDRNGKRIGGCPWATAIGHSGGRYRCTMNSNGLRRQALRAGSPEVFFTISGGRCARVPDAGRCFGSSKGKC